MAATVDFRSHTIIDLSFTDYFDTSGLSLMLHWLAEGRRMGGKVVICSDSPEFRSLTELVRISSVPAVYPALSVALDSFGKVATAIYTDDRQSPARVQRARAATAG